MGNCVGSPLTAEQLEEVARLRRERDEFRLAKQELEDRLQGAEEQTNLLRYKAEVLVQMLSVEERRREVLLRRLEASKFLALSQGVSAERLGRLLAPTDGEGAPGWTSADLSGAFTRMQEELDTRLLEIGRLPHLRRSC